MPKLQASGAFAQALDDNARALNGAYWKIYAAGTTTQATTYSNALLTIANAWPVIGDAAGRLPDIYVAPGNYRIRVETAGGVLIAESDNNVVYGIDPGEVAAAKFKTVSILKADETMGYALGGDVSVIVASGDIIEAGGFRYSVLASGATDQDLTTAGGVKLAVLQSPDGAVPFAAYGADPTGTTDVSALLLKAFARAEALSRVTAISSIAAQAIVTVNLQAAAEYLISDVTVPNTDIHYNIKCIGGRATLKGDGTSKGIIFEQIRNITFENITFQNFTTATEWDTNNVDGNLVRYLDCEWFDCDIGIDTVGFSVSRSTHLVLDRCRCGGVDRLVNSYCDMLTIQNGHFRNNTTDSALIFADSQLHVERNMWTPYFAGATARWFDVSNDASGTVIEVGRATYRFVGNRFGPEQSGGIPVLYATITGNTNTSVRNVSSGIYLHDNYCGCNNPDTPQCVIQLMSNAGGTATVAPNSITATGGSWNAVNGFVATEAGLTTGYKVGQMSITLDAAVQGQVGDETTFPAHPVIDATLNKFVSEWFIEGSPISVTGTQTVSVGRRKKFRSAPASALSITDLTDAMDGHQVTLVFSNSNTTIVNNTSGGAFYLSGGANWSPNANDALTVIYDRALNRWLEVSRSAN